MGIRGIMKRLICIAWLVASVSFGAYNRMDDGYEATDWQGYKLWMLTVAPSGRSDFPWTASSLEYLYASPGTNENGLIFDSSSYATNNFPGNTATNDPANAYSEPTNGMSGAYAFDNSTDSAQYFTEDITLNATNMYTIEWIMQADALPAFSGLLGDKGAASVSYMAIRNNNNIRFNTSDRDVDVAISPVLVVGEIYHCTISVSNAASGPMFRDTTLFVDGIQRGKTLGSPSPLFFNEIAQYRNGVDALDFDGKLWKMAIYTNLNMGGAYSGANANPEQVITNYIYDMARVGTINDYFTNSTEATAEFTNYCVLDVENQVIIQDGSTNRQSGGLLSAPTMVGTTTRGWANYDGSTDRNFLNDNPAYSFNDGGCVFAVVRETDLSTAQSYINKSDQATGAAEWELYRQAAPAGVTFTIFTSVRGNSLAIRADDAEIVTNKFLVYAANYDGGTTVASMDLYIDGLLSTNRASGTSGTFTGIVDTADAIMIGASVSNPSGSQQFQGDLGSLLIYNKAGGLSSNEIHTISTNLLSQYEGL